MRLRARRSFYVLMCLAALFAVAGAGHIVLTHESRAGSENQPVTAIDGDTIQLHGQVVQLYGIDAPEIGQMCLEDGVWQPCGLAAAHELNKQLRLSRRDVKCLPAADPGTSDEVCFAGNVDVAESLLTAGYVVVGSATSPDYRELEEKAREARLGLWHSEFVPPVDWREGVRLPGEADAEAAACPIKAIASGKQRGLYFVPTDDIYDSITLDPAAGDRTYCSDEKARADGWRRPGEADAS
jgi:endonuclease YncB( thermonuclease family)